MKRRYRSMLYVPGHNLEWMLKAPRFKPDGLIFDLEDAVSIDQTFRECSIPLVFAGLTCGLSHLARAESDPKACRGVNFEVKRPLVVSRVSARPHVNFIKGSDDDAACPADKEIC